MDDRAKSRVKLTLALAGLVSAMALTFVAYNIERNVRSKKTATESCVILRDAVEHEYTPEVLRMIFDREATAVRDALVTNQRVVCEATIDHLAWYRVNLFGALHLDRNEANEAHLRDVFTRAAESCPATFALALEGMPGSRSHERALEYGHAQCDRLLQNVEGIASIPEADYTAWDWAARINAVAHGVTERATDGRRAPSPW